MPLAIGSLQCLSASFRLLVLIAGWRLNRQLASVYVLYVLHRLGTSNGQSCGKGKALSCLTAAAQCVAASLALFHLLFTLLGQWLNQVIETASKAQTRALWQPKWLPHCSTEHGFPRLNIPPTVT